MRRAIRDVGRVRIGFETPPGQLGWVYELIADYGPRVVNHRGRCFTLEFQEWDAANSFLRSLFGQDVRPKDYAVRDSRFPKTAGGTATTTRIPPVSGYIGRAGPSHPRYR
jgi:hypothetical protein